MNNGRLSDANEVKAKSSLYKGELRINEAERVSIYLGLEASSGKGWHIAKVTSKDRCFE